MDWTSIFIKWLELQPSISTLTDIISPCCGLRIVKVFSNNERLASLPVTIWFWYAKVNAVVLISGGLLTCYITEIAEPSQITRPSFAIR